MDGWIFAMICELCGKEVKNIGSHLKYKHEFNGKMYYDRFYKTSEMGKCINCGKETRFFSINIGYAKYCSCKCKANSEENKIKTLKTRIKKYNTCFPGIEKLRQTRINRSINHFKEYFSKTCCDFLRYEPENNKRIYFKCRECGTENSVVRSLIDRLNRKNDFNICSYCFQRMSGSRLENDIYDYIKTIYNGKIQRNDRNVIKPKELDFWFPELFKAIEFDGEYWHKDKTLSDALKDKICEDKNIKLYRIKEIDWNNDNEVVKEKIKAFLM